MIAVDTSSFIAYLQGEDSVDVRWIDDALKNHTLVFPPIVISEVLSDIAWPPKLIESINQVPLLQISNHFWTRAGVMRAKIIGKKLKARLADTLIAQSCIDHNVPLITRDKDFRHFVLYAGLELFQG